jgi:transcription antitermination factor NusG
VRVVDGLLVFSGNVEEVKPDKEKLWVLKHIGRATPVELDFIQV